MSTEQFTKESCGFLRKDDGVYATAHDAAVAEDKDTIRMKVGQLYLGGTYDVDRGFVIYDTSSITADKTIISAYLKMYLEQDLSTTDFNIVIRRDEDGIHPGDGGFVVADFDYTFYEGDGGSINTADMSVGYNYLHFNSTGLGWINKTGLTKLAFISSRDIEELTPSGYEYVNLIGGFPPYTYPILFVTYDLETYPTVTTQAATNISDVSVKGNGTLTDGGAATEYGFQYGLTETPTWEVSKTENIEEGAFSLNINGLEPSTTYYYRAYATNSKGTAVGGWVSFATKASPSYGMYEEANTATLCFYVRKFGGKWSIKHGPYTTDQSDIEITKILEAQGKGKFQIKFESDVLTGLSAGVMVKCDVKART